MPEPTLVGRIARAQTVTAAIALLAVVLLSILGVILLVAQDRDRSLTTVAGSTARSLLEYSKEGPLDAAGVHHEVEEHRWEHIRVQVLTAKGGTVTAIGEGPSLQARADGECRDDSAHRVCERRGGPFIVLASTSLEDGRRTILTYLAVLLGTALLVLFGVAVSSRSLARRGLAPLAAFSRRLDEVRPGEGQRMNQNWEVAEIDNLRDRFDDLLGRVDATVARERRFSAQASHELRTPLTVLRGELELLASDPSDAVSAAGRALASTESLSRLVEALMLFCRAESKFQEQDLDMVDFGEVVEHALAAFQPRSAADPRIRANTTQAELLVLGDPHLLGRAVSNLVDNALKYGATEGSISVSLDIHDRHAELRVEDRGPGIDREARERIFEPFFRCGDARAQRDGHGLGLPFARAVARAHGGDVQFRPNDPQGSVFVLTLPIASDAVRAA
jgi:signal transduction histidine kinase